MTPGPPPAPRDRATAILPAPASAGNKTPERWPRESQGTRPRRQGLLCVGHILRKGRAHAQHRQGDRSWERSWRVFCRCRLWRPMARCGATRPRNHVAPDEKNLPAPSGGGAAADAAAAAPVEKGKGKAKAAPAPGAEEPHGIKWQVKLGRNTASTPGHRGRLRLHRHQRVDDARRVAGRQERRRGRRLHRRGHRQGPLVPAHAAHADQGGRISTSTTWGSASPRRRSSRASSSTSRTTATNSSASTPRARPTATTAPTSMRAGTWPAGATCPTSPAGSTRRP